MKKTSLKQRAIISNGVASTYFIAACTLLASPQSLLCMASNIDHSSTWGDPTSSAIADSATEEARRRLAYYENYSSYYGNYWEYYSYYTYDDDDGYTQIAQTNYKSDYYDVDYSSYWTYNYDYSASDGSNDRYGSTWGYEPISGVSSYYGGSNFGTYLSYYTGNNYHPDYGYQSYYSSSGDYNTYNDDTQHGVYYDSDSGETYIYDGNYNEETLSYYDEAYGTRSGYTTSYSEDGDGNHDVSDKYLGGQDWDDWHETAGQSTDDEWTGDINDFLNGEGDSHHKDTVWSFDNADGPSFKDRVGEIFTQEH